MTSVPENPPTTKRKVLICCFGSRGDVQPFAALGRGLRDEGSYEVLGATNVNDGVSIFESLGVKAEGVHFDMADFLRNDPAMKTAMETGNAIRFGLTMGHALTKHFPGEFSKQWTVARGFQPDLIVASTMVFLQASSIGQALRIPVVHADLGIFSFLPISKHTETELHEPRSLHGLASFFCVASMTIALHQKNSEGDSIYGTMRKEVSAPLESGGGGLPESERLLGQDGGGQFAREWMNPLTPNLFAVSDSVLPKSKFDDLPPLFAERSIWTGNWFVSKTLQEELARSGDPNFSHNNNNNNNNNAATNNNNAEEEDAQTVVEEDTQTLISGFIQSQKKLRMASGRPPVAPAYIGWGSMVAVSPAHMAQMAVKSLRWAGLPGIVLGGFAQLDEGLLLVDQDLCEYAQKHVLFLRSAPHDWLFPRCSVIVHHGGAGTTAAALRSGIPTIVTPCIADQYDNAALVEASGCGIGFKVPLRDITEQQLAEAMARCAFPPTASNSFNSSGNAIIVSNCKRVSEALAKEDGIQNAIDAIDAFWTTRFDTGEWYHEFEARLEQRATASWSTWHALSRVLWYREPFVEETS